VELGSRKRIRHADADVVRCGELDQFTRREQVGKLFAEITELDEKTDADAVRTEPLARVNEFADLGAFGHPVEHALAAAFRADPGFRATRAFERRSHRLG